MDIPVLVYFQCKISSCKVMADVESVKNRKNETRKQGRYKTISGILKTVTGISHFRHKNGEPVRSRSFEKIPSTQSDSETPNETTISNIERKDISHIKKKEFKRRHSEFSISTSARPRQPSITIKELDDNMRKMSYNKAKKKLKELLDTEIRYVENELHLILFSMVVILIIFANIKDIYDFHSRTFLPELKAAVDDPITLKNLFEDRKDSFKYKYGRYCVNKPLSEEKLMEHKLFFDDISKLMEKAEQFEKARQINEAIVIASGMANYVNDMMIVGRIDGFYGDVTKHGLLLKRGVESIVICTDEDKYKEVNVNTIPELKYWHHYPMNKLIIAEISDENNTFELKNDLTDLRNEDDDNEKYDDTDEVDNKENDHCIIFKCEDEESRNSWYREFNLHKSYLSNFADALSNPVM
ncbi:MCF2 [Lepeophtheirus salmonis]|uniref:MCF2 n=1 Tax=Lepeophtheirus salmonis TaxID=72036 RepID=A0A7R8HBS4_LEPSM|nr:MCF2 [Lepeophtheirus salmonis]CAF3000088.1 MCF2 [Lepeophtheirus salmonis]